MTIEEIVITPRDYLNLSDAECVFVENVNNNIFELIKKANEEGLKGKKLHNIYFTRSPSPYDGSFKVWLDFEPLKQLDDSRDQKETHTAI